jgi:thiol-disulfide isomerase/thioredoxin
MKMQVKYFFLFLGLLPGNAAFSKSLTVYLFLAETCPICQSVSLELRKLSKEYASDKIRFVGVFPDQVYSNAASRKAFSKKYGLDFDMQTDSAFALSNRFKTAVTPEVVVWDNEKASIVYRGKVDNSFASVGKRRTVVTEYYLRAAILHWEAGRRDLIVNTEPVGCFIQRQKK